MPKLPRIQVSPMAVAVVVTGLLLVLAAVWLAAGLRGSGQTARMSPTASPAAASPSLAPDPALANPMSIASTRAHSITPSAITTTQTLTARGGCRTSVVSFAADSYTQYALLQLPASAAPAGGYPVVILGHGYINPKAYQTAGSDYQGFMNALCGAGYAVLKPDYRGNGTSEGPATIGDLESAYAYDVLTLTASLPNLTGVNPRKVGWLGHSMGGAIMLRAAVASHGLPVGAIVFASGVVGSASDVLFGWPINMFPADLAAQKQSFIASHGTPDTNPTFWHDISAINYVDAIPAPVSINHGTADAVVPLVFSEHLRDALTSAGKPFEYHTYPGGDHQYGTAGSGQAFLTSAIAFLNAHVKN